MVFQILLVEYFFVKNTLSSGPHMMHTLISRHIVLKLPAVICAAERLLMPVASAAAEATCVS